MNTDLTLHSVALSNVFFSFGIAIGMTIAASLYLFALSLSYRFLRNKPNSSRLILYGAISTLIFSLFALICIPIHSPKYAFLFPDWLLFLGKASAPIGVYFYFQMFLQAIPIKNTKAYSFWKRAKKYYALTNILLFISIFILFFINDSFSFLFASFSIIFINNIIGAIIAHNAIEESFFKRFHQRSVLSIAFADFICIYLCLFIDIETIPPSVFIMLHFCYSLLIMVYYSILTHYIANDSQYEDSNKYHAHGFYKSVYKALNDNEFFLEYQPKIVINTRNVCAVEALIRWNHPKNGVIPPNNFIILSERSDLINLICQWTIKQVISDIKHFRQQNIHIPVAINFSVKNIYPDMVHFLLEQLQNQQLTTDTIIIEITETLFLDMNPEQLKAIHLLKKAGIKLSMDDFGAGHSSLKHLGEMEPSEIKLDRSLINSIMRENNQTIVHTLVNMCDAMGIQSVAEGIEDNESLEILENFHCEMAQGYGICRPKSIKEVIQWIQTDNNKHYKNITG